MLGDLVGVRTSDVGLYVRKLVASLGALVGIMIHMGDHVGEAVGNLVGETLAKKLALLMAHFLWESMLASPLLLHLQDSLMWVHWSVPMFNPMAALGYSW